MKSLRIGILVLLVSALMVSGCSNSSVSVKPEEKGTVTITAPGDYSYNLGEEITFSGTNTVTKTTYLFITGPNLPENGGQIDNLNQSNTRIINGDATTFKSVPVNANETWSWRWNTDNVVLDSGSYAVYAVSDPKDKNNLDGVQYGAVSIILKKPFIKT